MNRIIAPPAVPPETVVLQGKSRRGPGSVPFGGSDGLVCLSRRAQVLPQRGHGLRSQLPHRRNRRQLGVHDRRPWPPSRHP
jgi:hypothetical protein